jgi:hypothetical protein
MRITVLLLGVFALGAVQLSEADPPQVKSASSSATPGAPRLTETAAIRIALAEARRRKFDLRSLDAPRATFLQNAKGGTWSVYFQNKWAVEDGCFWMLIDDRTGKVNPIMQACG